MSPSAWTGTLPTIAAAIAAAGAASQLWRRLVVPVGPMWPRLEAVETVKAWCTLAGKAGFAAVWSPRCRTVARFAGACHHLRRMSTRLRAQYPVAAPRARAVLAAGSWK